MSFCGAEGVSRTLWPRKGTLRLSVPSEMERHSDYTGVLDVRVGWFSFGILWKMGGFGRSIFFGGVGGMEA